MQHLGKVFSEMYHFWRKPSPLRSIDELLPTGTLKTLDDRTPIPREVHDFLWNERYEDLDYGHQVVTPDPIISRSIDNCNAAVLFGEGRHGGIIGFSHYPRSNTKRSRDPKEYFPDLLRDTRRQTQDSPLQALLIGGDRDHFTILANLLADRRIPIIGGYVDGWSDVYEWKEGDGREDLMEKDLLVFPREKTAYLLFQDRATYGESYNGCIPFKV
ncbi:hypothetical protein HYW21_05700 [Candidatus Woesearchaeota archaeon]|nr:hypothetical protein [Candidatus Woesearchaeota archaeon]